MEMTQKNGMRQKHGSSPTAKYCIKADVEAWPGRAAYHCNGIELEHACNDVTAPSRMLCFLGSKKRLPQMKVHKDRPLGHPGRGRQALPQPFDLAPVQKAGSEVLCA